MQKILVLLLCAVSAVAFGQQSLQLKVESYDKQPLVGAVVHFVGKHYITDREGSVVITSLKAGVYPIKVSYLGYTDFQGNISVPQQGVYTIAMREEVTQLAATSVVGTIAERREEATKAVTTIAKPALQQQRGEELAKVLTSVAGVSMIQTGATIAKPVIHGLHSNRILILNNEVRQEGQQWGADHAPEIDPSVADKISVVKGADAVRYGSDALGGVVIIAPNKLPYGDGLHGELSPSFASNGRRTAMTVKAESSVPKLRSLAWRLQGSLKRSGDLSTANYLLNNTAAAERDFSVALGYEKHKAGVELFYSRYENESSVFYGSHIGNLDDLLARFEIGRPLTIYPFSYELNAPKQKVVHHLLKAKGHTPLLGGTLTAQYAYQDDVRQEFNVRRLDRTRIPALDMDLNTHSLDVNWQRQSDMSATHRWDTQLGVSAISQDNYNQPGTGVVPVIPNFVSLGYGAFAVEKYSWERWLLEGGLRYDYKYLNADGYDSYAQRYGGEHEFHNLTYSLGAMGHFASHWRLSTNLGFAWRAPHVNELYSSGLHHGAGTYELGDEHLKSETGIKWIISTTYRKQDLLELTLDVYAQLIKNYIYDYPTGDTRTLFSGVYPIFQYTQADAFFRGADLDGKLCLLSDIADNDKLWYDLRASVVFASEQRTGRYFPYIPAPKFTHSLRYEVEEAWGMKHLKASLGHTFVAKQTCFEPSQELVSTTPEAYHLFEASLGATVPISETQSLSLYLSAENLFNTEYKEYTNRFRYYAHDLGRNVLLRVVYNF
jgi:putative tonB dependent receptor